MSTINKSKTEMHPGHLQPDQNELLIPIKFLSKKEIKQEKDYYQYEMLRHRLKKKITEKIIDNIANIVKENENKKDIHVLASLNTKSDSKGLYQRLKKLNKRINEPHELKGCFLNWLYKTPNVVEKRKRSKISKNDRNKKIVQYFFNYKNLVPNIMTKTTDMTTRKKKNLSINTKNLPEKPKYKYNYSSNNSNVSYNKFEYGGTDPNKGNIYIGKRNGDASYYHQKNYNNFGSLTIIQHNVDNSKKNGNIINNFRNTNRTGVTNRSLEKRNELTVGTRSLRNSNSSSLIFMNSYGGSRSQKNEENRDTDALKKEIPANREKKVWTVRKETYECKEVF